MRLDEILSTNAVSEAIGSQWDWLSLSLQSLTQILWRWPPFEDVISFEYIRDNAWYVFWQVFLIKPQWIEAYFTPRNAVYLTWHPHFRTLNNSVLHKRIGMAIGYEIIIDSSFFVSMNSIDLKSLFGMGIVLTI